MTCATSPVRVATTLDSGRFCAAQERSQPAERVVHGVARGEVAGQPRPSRCRARARRARRRGPATAATSARPASATRRRASTSPASLASTSTTPPSTAPAGTAGPLRGRRRWDVSRKPRGRRPLSSPSRRSSRGRRPRRAAPQGAQSAREAIHGALLPRSRVRMNRLARHVEPVVRRGRDGRESDERRTPCRGATSRLEPPGHETDPTPGDPDAVRRVATAYSGIAAQAERATSRSAARDIRDGAGDDSAS